MKRYLCRARADLAATIGACLVFATGVSLAQDNIMLTSGSWLTPGNWSLGHLPIGAERVIINTTVTASGAPTNAYTGTLTLREGAGIDSGDNQFLDADLYPSGGTQAFFHAESWVRHDAGTLSAPLVLNEHMTIMSGSHGSSRLNVTAAISGSGGIRYREQRGAGSGRYTWVSPATSNMYGGGTVLVPWDEAAGSGLIVLNGDGAFGVGDVTVTRGFELQAGGYAFVDSRATLHFDGAGKVDFAGSPACRSLFIDGVQQASGTWGGSGSGATYTNTTHFSGGGLLTVTGGADVSPPWPSPAEVLVYDSYGVDATTIVVTAVSAVDASLPVLYLFTNRTTGAASGWQTSVTWTNDVPAGAANACTVKARDALGNETLWSDVHVQYPLVANIMTSSGSWADGANWSLGRPPAGGETVIIDSNVTVNGGIPTNSYTGDLTLREGAGIDSGNNAFLETDMYPQGGARTYFNAESWVRHDAGTLAVPVVLNEHMTIISRSHGSSRLNISGAISGVGGIRYREERGAHGGRYTWVSPVVPNTYSGGTLLEAYDPYYGVSTLVLQGGVPFGTGDLTLRRGVWLTASGRDFIDAQAALHFDGGGTIDFTGSEACRWLFIDGVQQADGTWGASGSGAANIDDTHFAGSGVLTVAAGTDVSPPWPSPMQFSVYECYGLDATTIVHTAVTALDVSPPVSYLFTNLTSGTSSGWQSGATWTNIVAVGAAATCKVKAKDSLGNETLWSDAYEQFALIENVMTVSGAWTDGAKWSLGHPPAGAETAILDAGVSATGGATNRYDGDFVLRAGARFHTTALTATQYPQGAYARIRAHEGSSIRHDLGTLSVPLVLEGALALESEKPGGGMLLVTSPISGSGAITFKMGPSGHGRETDLKPSAYSTYSGGTILEPLGLSSANGIMYAVRNTAFGTGDLTIGPQFSLRSESANNVVDNGATVYVDAAASWTPGNETIGKLYIAGKPMPAGTWGSAASTAEFTSSVFAGTGVVIVLDDDVPPGGCVLMIR